MSVVLVGDVGGTNTRLALFSTGSDEPAQLEIYPSAEHGSLEEIVGAFLAEHPAEPRAATVGVAGPVRDGRTEAINLRWSVDAVGLAAKLGLAPGSVAVINDLEANGWGIAALSPGDLESLNAAEPAKGGTVALVSAGTGLGEAFVSYGPAGPTVHPSEGGHADFAPRGELQSELHAWLTRRADHVSYELVCSGQGLVNVYEFLRQRSSQPEPDWLHRRLAGGDGAAAISAAGLERRDEVASEALDLMISIYGAKAGNLALTVLATGGVYLGGGIPPRILPRLRKGGFVEAFAAKGRLGGLLERIPVRVILNDRAALLGAARHAAERLAG